MNKLSAIIKREYLQRVRNKWFILATLIAPLILAAFMVLPALLGTMQTGGKTHLAVVDQTGRLFDGVRDLINSDGSAEDQASTDNKKAADKKDTSRYEIERVQMNERPLDEVKRELNQRVHSNQLDGYLLIPEDVLTKGEVVYYGRNAGDIFAMGQLKDRLSEAVREQRLRDAQMNRDRIRELSKPINLNSIKVSDQGEEKDSGGSFVLSYLVGGLIYITTLIYGGMIMSAVIEEKTTRVAEMLFSSVRPFPLMLGKLLGVSLVALTQCAIWGVAIGLVALYGAGSLAASGIALTIPKIALSAIVYFVLFFLLGYFVYATLYTLIGSMVTTPQEGQQMAMPIVFILVFAFSMIVPVLRSPNSSFSFWISLVPFFSPITMLVRIFSQTPPFWQIALSLIIGFSTVLLLIWFASRIYRIGMLMYGKRASLPEMWRWIRQP